MRTVAEIAAARLNAERGKRGCVGHDWVGRSREARPSGASRDERTARGSAPSRVVVFEDLLGIDPGASCGLVGAYPDVRAAETTCRARR